VRDASTGATAHVVLPSDTVQGPSWTNAVYAFDGLDELWVFSGGGPVYARHYLLSGSPLPASAVRESTTAFGDADSRAEDMTMLAGGGLAGVWHQQGDLGPQGQGVAYRNPSGVWSTVFPITFVPTHAAVQTVAQHPADGSIWVFCDPDAYGAIAAMRLHQSGSGLTLDWTDSMYINQDADGAFGPDPENPDLEAVADPSTGTIALAYQSEQRVIFQSYPFVAGSYPAVTRIAANGSKTYLALPVYAERVSRIGIVVRAGETWLAYRPVDPGSLTSKDLYANVYRNGAWGTATRLGATASLITGFGGSRPEFGSRFDDATLKFFSL
jgi:hypothetical protein